MSHRVRIIITGLVAALVLVGTQVAAGIVVDPREFSGGQTRLNFDDLAVGTAVTIQYQADGVTFALEGTSLEPVLVTDSPARYFVVSGDGPNALTNSVGTGLPYPNLEITFDSPVNRIAFEIRTNDGDDLAFELICIAAGHVVGTDILSTYSGYRYLGVESPMPLDRIILNVTGASNGSFSLDNLSFEYDLTDGDADGVLDIGDNCPANPNATQDDADADGIGDACAPDPLLLHNGLPFADPANAWLFASYLIDQGPFADLHAHLADDVLFSSGGWRNVTGIRWMGVEVDTANPDTFTRTVDIEREFDIWFLTSDSSGIATPPPVTLEADPPASAYAHRRVKVRALTSPSPFGNIVGLYTAQWNSPVILQPGARYWISIAAVSGFNDIDAFNGGNTGRLWGILIGDGTGNGAVDLPSIEGGDMLGLPNWQSTEVFGPAGGFVPQFDLVGFENTPPLCDAGGPYVLTCDNAPVSFVLDGSGSSDPDGNPLNYAWTSSCGGLDDASAISPTLTISDPCATPSCSVSLTVSDARKSKSCNPGSVVVNPKADLADVDFLGPLTRVQVPIDDVTAFSIPLVNAGSCPARSDGADVVTDFSIPSINVISLVPSLNAQGAICPGGASVNLSVDSNGAIGGTYSGLLRLLGHAGADAVTTDLEIFVNEGLLADLSATAAGGLDVSGDSGEVPLDNGEGFALSLVVTNIGEAPAAPFSVDFFADGALLGSQAVGSALAIGGTATVSLSLVGGTLLEGTHVLEAQIVTALDGDLSTDNNVASAFVQVGSPVTGGAIIVNVSPSVGCSGETIRFEGSASYLIETATFPVKGAPLTVSLLDANSGLPVVPAFSGHTTVTGAFGGRFSVPTPGSYKVRAEVSDLSLSGLDDAPITIAAGSTCSTGTVSPPGSTPVVEPTPVFDMSLCSTDLELLEASCTSPLAAAPTSGDSVCVRTTVHYYGNLSVYDQPIRLGAYKVDASPVQQVTLGTHLASFDVSTYPPGTVLEATQTFETPWVVGDAGSWMVKATVDSTLTQNYKNDSGSRSLIVGADPVTAELDVTASSAGCTDFVGVFGSVRYVGPGGRAPDSPVASCIDVDVTLFDTDGLTILASGSGRTNAYGQYSISMPNPGIVLEQDYPVEANAVDGSLSGVGTTTHRCGPRPTTGGSGGGGGTGDDLFVYAEDIVFLGDASCSTGLPGLPDVGQTVGIHATLRQSGSTAYPDEPVTVTEFLPVNGSMVGGLITLSPVPVSFDGTGASPLCVEWTPATDGTRIVQVELDPTFGQNTANDAATRAITVGTPACHFELESNAATLHRGESLTLELSASTTLGILPLVDLGVQAVPPLSLPAGLTGTFSPATQLVVPFSASLAIGTNFATPPGGYPLLVTGFGEGCSAVETINLDVLNQGPSVGALADQAITAGETLSLAALASDPEGDAITLTASGLPPFVTFIDGGSGSGSFDIAPGFSDVGSFTGLTVTATDAYGATATASFNLDVASSGPAPCGGLGVQVDRHTVQTGAHPGSTKDGIAGLEVRAYDKSSGSCAAGIGISWQNYPDIWALCDPAGVATTAADGLAVVPLPAGNYLAIGEYDGDGLPPDGSGNEIYIGNSIGGFDCAADGDPLTVSKSAYLQVIETADGRKVPAKYKRRTGSELLVIEPEYVLWDETEQLYPFVFQSLGDWSVSTSVAPPEGFVADHDQLAEDVTSEVEAVQFTITEIGSDLVPTETTFEVEHNGHREVIRSRVGILLTPSYARSRGFNVAELRALGLIVDPPGIGPQVREGARHHGQGATTNSNGNRNGQD